MRSLFTVGVVCLGSFVWAVSPDPRFCGDLVVRHGLPSERWAQYALLGSDSWTLFDFAPEELRAKLVAAASAMLWSDGMLATDLAQSGAVHALWRLGMPLEELRERVRPPFDAYLRRRVEPGERVLAPVPDAILRGVAPEVLEATGVAREDASHPWVRRFEPIIDLRWDPRAEAAVRELATNPAMYPELTDERFMLSAFSPFRERDAAPAEHETSGGVLYETFEVAWSLRYPEAERLARFLVATENWADAARAGDRMRNDVFLFNLGVLHFARATLMMAQGKHVTPGGLDLLEGAFAAAITALGYVQDPALKPNARRLLVEFADEVTSEAFFQRRRRADPTLGAEARFGYLRLALKALLFTGRVVEKPHPARSRQEHRVVLDLRDWEVAEKARLLVARASKVIDDTFVGMKSEVLSLLEALEDAEALRTLGKRILEARHESTLHRFEHHFELAFDFLLAAWETDRRPGKGTLESWADPFLAILFEEGIPGSRTFSLVAYRQFEDWLARFQRLGYGKAFALFRQAVVDHGREDLERAVIQAHAGRPIDFYQEARFPFDSRVPDGLRTLAVRETFRAPMLNDVRPTEESA